MKLKKCKTGKEKKKKNLAESFLLSKTKYGCMNKRCMCLRDWGKTELNK